jgi:hypothetical protein
MHDLAIDMIPSVGLPRTDLGDPNASRAVGLQTLPTVRIVT